MSNKDFDNNTGNAAVEDGTVDGTTGVEDEDAAAPVDILDTTVQTRCPHPDLRTSEARREAVRTRSVSAAPTSGDISPVEVLLPKATHQPKHNVQNDEQCSRFNTVCLM